MKNLDVIVEGCKEEIKVEFCKELPFEDNINLMNDKISPSKEFLSVQFKRAIVSGRELSDAQKLITQSVIRKAYGNIEIEFDEPQKNVFNLFRGIDKGDTVFYRGTLRSGQKVESDGNLVVVGDVNPGAELLAAGNIVIFGILRGIVHAGCGGNDKAFICAVKINPSQIRIANVITRSPDEKIEENIEPEIALIQGDTIMIQSIYAKKI